MCPEVDYGNRLVAHCMVRSGHKGRFKKKRADNIQCNNRGSITIINSIAVFIGETRASAPESSLASWSGAVSAATAAGWGATQLGSVPRILAPVNQDHGQLPHHRQPHTALCCPTGIFTFLYKPNHLTKWNNWKYLLYLNLFSYCKILKYYHVVCK